MNTNTYSPTQEQFQRELNGATIETLLDNGLYRHRRFRLPNGCIRWFDIITWPDSLIITGDCETFAFERLEDMFEFFRSAGSRINPSYWQEKIIDGRDRARSFDWDRFRAEALAKFDESKIDAEDSELRAAAREDLEEAIDATNPDEWGAVQLLREYGYTLDGQSGPSYFYFDLSESPPDGMDWDYHYIWCCRAIVWAIQKYDEEKANAEKETLEV